LQVLHLLLGVIITTITIITTPRKPNLLLGLQPPREVDSFVSLPLIAFR
jgi:hypothetical protein